MPEWVVPVLRLVSSTHVEPTTGIVLSVDGLVLVPGNFAAHGDEIVILDGGTDIIRHGRPARLHMNFPAMGLALLRTDGLHRSGAPLAPASPASGDSLRLRAFPPAEQIAEGSLPLDVLTTVSAIAESGAPLLAAEAPLPNVTGALLDNCGNLAGISLADGVQSLTPAPATQYRWAIDLYAVFAELGLPVRGTACASSSAAVETAPPATAEASARPQEVGRSVADETGTEKTDADDTQPAELSAPDETASKPAPSLEVLPPFEQHESSTLAPAVSASPETSRRLWLWLLAALLLLVSGVAVHWLRRPGEVRLSLLDSLEAKGSEAAATPVEGAAIAEALPGEPACRLVLRGAYATGQSFEAAKTVNARAINAEIGRGAVDLVIDSPSVSRRHARLSGTHQALTLTDLGSSNGSSINGVPCLEGEVMYVETGAVIVLGDTRFTVAIEDGEPAGGGP